MTFRERKEVLITWARWESIKWVDPECGFLGRTENTSSIPPVMGPPDPALILILPNIIHTFNDNAWYFSLNKFAWVAVYGLTLTILWLFPVNQM